MCMSGSSGLQSLVPASGQRRRSGRRSSSTSCCLSLLAFPLLEQHPEPLRPRAGGHPSFFSWAGRLKAHLGSLEQNELLGMNPGHGFFCLFHPWEAYFVPVSLSRPASLFLLIFLFIAGVDELTKGWCHQWSGFLPLSTGSVGRGMVLGHFDHHLVGNLTLTEQVTWKPFPALGCWASGSKFCQIPMLPREDTLFLLVSLNGFGWSCPSQDNCENHSVTSKWAQGINVGAQLWGGCATINIQALKLLFQRSFKMQGKLKKSQPCSYSSSAAKRVFWCLVVF